MNNQEMEDKITRFRTQIILQIQMQRLNTAEKIYDIPTLEACLNMLNGVDIMDLEEEVYTTKNKIYLLVLNDMRSSNIELVHIVVISYERNNILNFYQSQREDWSHTLANYTYSKSFKAGSQLEWYNRMTNEETGDCGGYEGIIEYLCDEVELNLMLSKYKLI